MPASRSATIRPMLPPPTASCCRASAPSPTAGPVSTRCPACTRRSRRPCAGKGRPFLGICVGMQLMAERGLEFRITPGFGWIKGDVQAIEPSDPALKIPHMGWNTLDVVNPHPLLAGIPTGPGRAARLFRALLPPRHDGSRGGGGGDELRWTGDRDGRGRQHRGHAVPPGEEPDAGTAAHLQFPEVAALSALSRSSGRGHGVQRAAPGVGSRPLWLQAAGLLGTQRHWRPRWLSRRRFLNQRSAVLSSTAVASTCWISNPSSLSR